MSAVFPAMVTARMVMSPWAQIAPPVTAAFAVSVLLVIVIRAMTPLVRDMFRTPPPKGEPWLPFIVLFEIVNVVVLTVATLAMPAPP